MRPLTRSIIRALVLGVLTTVGVAWAIHLTASPANRPVEGYYRARVPERNEGEGAIDVERIRAPGKTWLKILAMHSSPNSPVVVPDTLSAALPAWERGLCTPWNSRTWPTDKYDRAYITAVGWPCRALWHEYLYNPALDVPSSFLFLNQHPPAHTYQTPGAIRLGKMTTEFGAAAFKVPGSLPYQPLLRGFTINTALSAAIWLVILITPGRMRRWSRIRQGRCPSCAYDLRGSRTDAPCPECGAIAPQREADRRGSGERQRK